MRRIYGLLLAGFWACGDGAGTLPGPRDIDPQAMPVIAEFSADRGRVDVDGYLRLTWEVNDARTIEIFDERSTVVSTFDARGTVVAGPIDRDKIFYLRAANRDKVTTAELAVSVNWQSPTLAIMPPADQWSVGQVMILRWDSTNAAEIIIERDGTEILRKDAVEGSDSRGLDIVAGRQFFKVIAQNPIGRQEIGFEVTGAYPVELERFVVRPRVWLGTPMTVQLEWTARHSDKIEIYFGPSDPPGETVLVHAATDEEVGAVDLMINAPGSFYLSGTNLVSGNTVTAEVWWPNNEEEPNDDYSWSRSMGVGARGEISSAEDVDYFGFPATPTTGPGYRFYLTAPDGSGCEVDAKITLENMSDVSFSSSDGAAESAGGGFCPRLDVTQEQIEMLLLAGTSMFLRVEGELGSLGRYVLFTEAL